MAGGSDAGPRGGRGTSRLWLQVLAFVGVLLFARLGVLPLLDPDEGRNASVGLEMHQSGAWVIPTYNGLPYLDKPAFTFKAVALSIDAFGWSEWAARLPFVLFSIAVLAMLYLVCRREYGPRPAAMAVLIAATTPLFLAFSRIVIPDMPLAVFVCGSIFAGYLAETHEGRRRRAWYAAAAVSAGMATLVKGPVGFLLPAFVVAAYHLFRQEPRALLRMFGPLNLGLFLATVLPWFLGVTHFFPDFPHYGIVVESLSRVASDDLGRSKPFYYFGPLLFVGCLGWSLLYPGAIALAWKRRRSLADIDRLFIAWAVGTVIFFSLSKSKMPGYVLTTGVALAALVARLFESALTDPAGPAARTVQRGTRVLAGLYILLGCVLALEHLWPGLLSSRLVNHKTDPTWIAPLIKTVALCVLGSGLLAFFASRRSALASLWGFAVLPLSFVLFALGDAATYAQWQSAKGIAQGLERLAPGAQVVCVQAYPPGITGYLGRTVTLVSEEGRQMRSNYILYMLERDEAWPDAVIRRAEFEPWLEQRAESVVLLAKRLHHLEPLAQEHHVETVEITPGWWALALPAPEAH